MRSREKGSIDEPEAPKRERGPGLELLIGEVTLCGPRSESHLTGREKASGLPGWLRVVPVRLEAGPCGADPSSWGFVARRLRPGAGSTGSCRGVSWLSTSAVETSTEGVCSGSREVGDAKDRAPVGRISDSSHDTAAVAVLWSSTRCPRKLIGACRSGRAIQNWRGSNQGGSHRTELKKDSVLAGTGCG